MPVFNTCVKCKGTGPKCNWLKTAVAYFSISPYRSGMLNYNNSNNPGRFIQPMPTFWKSINKG